MEGWQDDKREAERQASERATAEAVRAEAEGRPAPSPPPSNLPAPDKQIKATFGKAANSGSYQKVVKVDIDRFLTALKTRPEWFNLINFLETMAQKMASDGIILDGVQTEEKTKIR